MSYSPFEQHPFGPELVGFCTPKKQKPKMPPCSPPTPIPIFEDPLKPEDIQPNPPLLYPPKRFEPESPWPRKLLFEEYLQVRSDVDINKQ